MNPLRMLALALTVAMLLAVPSGAQETDHLACVKVKDSGIEPPANVLVSLTAIFDDSLTDCEVKKAKMVSLCVPVANLAVNGGNDPRAGAVSAESYGCYKVRCKEGKPDGSASSDDALGGNRFTTRTKLLTLCTPGLHP